MSVCITGDNTHTYPNSAAFCTLARVVGSYGYYRHMETVTHNGLKVPTMQLGDRLRRIRRDEGLSQDAFAAALGIHKEAYSTYESGRNRPSDVVRLASDIEARFGVAAWWTLGLSDPRTSDTVSVTRQYPPLCTSPPRRPHTVGLSPIRRKHSLIAEPLKITGGTRDEYEHAHDLGLIRQPSFRLRRIRRHHPPQDRRHAANIRGGH